MRTRSIAANEVRIPEPAAGEVIVIERYGKPYAAIIDESTLELFQRLLAIFGEPQPVELSLSDTALAAHEISESGADVEDFDFALLDTHAA
jgi:hypothetical protein